MSLIPFLFDCDPWEFRRHHHPRRNYNEWDQFGLGISPAEIQILTSLPSLLSSSQKSNVNRREVQPVVGKNGFQVHMDVKQFKPSEIAVKTVDNNIVIEGKHEERQDEHGYISRHFVRKYSLPEGYDANDVVSTLSSDGFLTVKAPPPSKSIEGNERIVTIQQTGPASVNVKENQSMEVQKEE